MAEFLCLLQQSVLKAYSHLLKVETSRFRSSPTISLASKGTFLYIYKGIQQGRNETEKALSVQTNENKLALLTSYLAIPWIVERQNIKYLNKLCLDGLLNPNLSYFRPVISEIFYLLADFFFKNKEFRYLSRWFSVYFALYSTSHPEVGVTSSTEGDPLDEQGASALDVAFLLL